MARPESRRPGSSRPTFVATLTLSGLVAALSLALPRSAWGQGNPHAAPMRVRAQAATPANTPGTQPISVSTLPPPFPLPPELQGVDLMRQSKAEAHAKSHGCVKCHQNVSDMHNKPTLNLGCTDCHGGNADCDFPGWKMGERRGCPAAPPSRNPSAWTGSANPVRSYALLNHENPEFIRFVNPGDLRVAHISCGTTNCHPKEVMQVKKSMMTHGCMLWGAALYNNGGVPFKPPRYGESYSMHGVPLRIQTVPPPTEWEKRHRGVLPFLDPLPKFEMSQPGNILRIFERGGKFRPETGIPERREDPGRPISTKLSDRGIGTQNRTDPVFIGLQKTRLLDPTLNFLGTNDHPGDYRSSGCTACHVVYANDRSPVHSGPYAKFGHMGTYHGKDPMIPKNEPGHPIDHAFAKGNSIPSSQCMICHMHPGTTVMNSYLGYMWYDVESDGHFMYPESQPKRSAQEIINLMMSNPDENSLRGNWSNQEFLRKIWDNNDKLKHNQFADFHGHGWVFRAVFKTDRKGIHRDYFGNVVANPNAENLKRGVNMPIEIQELYRNWDKKSPKERSEQQKQIEAKRHGVAMHLLDIHLEKGMHCVDCHFVQDMHGNERLQGEVRAAIEIQCIDCHGTVTQYANLRTTGPAAYTSTPDKNNLGKDLKDWHLPKDRVTGRDLSALKTPWGKPRFERRGNKLVQHSMVEKDMSWEIVQTRDTVNPASEHWNPRAALAKTVRFGKDGKLTWGDIPAPDPKTPDVEDSGCAHSNAKMTCITCHSSWNPSCYGCHLPQKANMKMPELHNRGDVSRNYVSYNWQTLREEVFMLARDGNATGNRINPSRSSCAIHVGSYNNNRESIYVQQQTISAEGFSGIAFSTNVPHTVGGKGTTKLCTDCHVSKDDDNNAIMAQLLMHGTGYLNFMGRYVWVAAKNHGLFSVIATEREEPQAVIGSTLHELAYPEEFKKHVKNGRMLKEAHEHPGRDIGQALFRPFLKSEPRKLLVRGEYLYTACGEGGVRIFDVAFIDHKGFSERIATAPVSPAGQRFYVKTKFATDVAAPATTAPDPTRKHFEENHEGRVHGMYGSIYVTDRYEGLIVIGIATLIDGNPLNNFLKRTVTFNPNGILCGAESITIIGTYAYICCDAGLVVVSLNDPSKPEVKCVIGKKYLKKPKAVAAQFRYAYVADEEDVKVFDITDLENPKPVSKIAIPHVHNIYLARTYAYLAAGKMGLVILDIENPEVPKVDQIFTADGCINDLHDVKLAITYVSQFAYLADGKNGMRIVQLTSPDTPGNVGFSPRPTPKLIATYKIPNGGHAYAIGRALDRDRAVDESGNQLSVFGRVGARPLNLEEQRKMYLRDGKVWKVSDDWRDPRYHQNRYVEPRLAPRQGDPKLPSQP